MPQWGVSCSLGYREAGISSSLASGAVYPLVAVWLHFPCCLACPLFLLADFPLQTSLSLSLVIYFLCLLSSAPALNQQIFPLFILLQHQGFVYKSLF